MRIFPRKMKKINTRIIPRTALLFYLREMIFNAISCFIFQPKCMALSTAGAMNFDLRNVSRISSSHFGEVFTAILILSDQKEHLGAQELLFQCKHGSKWKSLTSTACDSCSSYVVSATLSSTMCKWLQSGLIHDFTVPSCFVSFMTRNSPHFGHLCSVGL